MVATEVGNKNSYPINFSLKPNKIWALSPNNQTMETVDEKSNFTLSTKKNKKYSMNTLFVKENIF